MTDDNNTTIKPFLTVNNAKKASEFYIAAFGAKESKRFEMPNEKLTSVIEIEKAEFYVGDEEPQYGNLSPDLKSNSPVRIILQTKNTDELFEKTLKSSATEICPMTTERNRRIGKLKDTFGKLVTPVRISKFQLKGNVLSLAMTYLNSIVSKHFFLYE